MVSPLLILPCQYYLHLDNGKDSVTLHCPYLLQSKQSLQLWYPFWSVGKPHSNFPYFTFNLEQSKSYEAALDSCINTSKDLLSIAFWLTQLQLFYFIFNRLSCIIKFTDLICSNILSIKFYSNYDSFNSDQRPSCNTAGT